MLLQNLHCRYLYIVIGLPHLKDLDQKIPSFSNCDNYGICRDSNPNPLNDDTRTNDNKLHQQLCGTFKIDYLQEMDIITKVKSGLECKINVTLPALLPNKITSDSRGLATSSDKIEQDKSSSRNKRDIPLLAIAQGTAAIGGVLIKGINALVYTKRANSFNNAIKMLNANVEITHNRLVTLENRTSMMAKANMPVLKDLKSEINKTNEQLASQYRLMSSAHNRYNLLFRQMHEMQTIHHFALLLFKNYLTIQVGTLQRIHRQYTRYESVLDDTLIGIENLNSGYLTHQILDPQVLTKYLEIIEDDLEDTAPEYEPVFTSVYQYYGNSLASFTNTIDDLLLQLPILIKLKVQVPMSLFSIETVPVPLDAETYIGDKREYTQITPESKYIALTDNNYVPLTQAQKSLCAKIGYTYYCEYVHLLKKCTEHTCMSAIYYDQESKIKANQCKTIVTFDNTLESKILDTSNILILSNLQKPWTIACKDVSRVFEIEYSTYHILNRLELCECSLTAGNYLLSQTDTNCRDMPAARDGYFTSYYAFNKIILEVITVKFNIQVDDRTITQSTLLHDDIPGYNLLTLEFVLPPVNDDEDLILEEENPEIYMHPENVLVHMIDTQDVAIFKSQKDYARNKQKLLEYIHYAQMWQVLSVIFSHVAFTCDIIPVITLIIFFIRYRKMMQAMLTAFITTNTSNSGIPSAKANPISRTFPSLFTIKISEEEKIVEDLQEIESMQLIVQVIMVIVCIIVAFIVLYYCCKKFRHVYVYIV